MKKTKLFICLVTVLSITLLCVPSFAAGARASEQICVYRMGASASKGSLDIEFSITGNGTMNKIGCQSIYVYRHEGNSWRFCENVLEDDPGMSKTNTFTYQNVIYCNGEAGVEYKIVVTVFAENDAGRDARAKIIYVTGQ